MLKPLGANKTELHFDGSTVLFSYETPVAIIERGHKGTRYYKTSKKWSRTTSKHINQWFGSHGINAHAAVEKPQDFINKFASFARIAVDAIE